MKSKKYKRKLIGNLPELFGEDWDKKSYNYMRENPEKTKMIIKAYKKTKGATAGLRTVDVVFGEVSKK